MELAQGVAALTANQHSTIVTIKRDGKPQLSNVVHSVGETGLVRVSITATRAKYHNLVRTPWAALHVNGPEGDFWSYAVIECEASLSPVAGDPHDAVADELVELYGKVAAQVHPDWDEYRRAMVADQRVVLTLTPVRAYGMLRG
jgi:PPOX class probable F420-dependent enzyme